MAALRCRAVFLSDPLGSQMTTEGVGVEPDSFLPFLSFASSFLASFLSLVPPAAAAEGTIDDSYMQQE